MLKLLVSLLLIYGAAGGVVPAAAEQQHVDIDFIEDGMLIKESVTQYGDDLQVLEVPEHGSRPHIVAYLDFRSRLQLIKDVKQQKCQLSNMEPQTKMVDQRLLSKQSHDEGGFSLPDLPIDASRVTKMHIFKLERHETIQNTSYLRVELRQACVGLPIHWADSIDEQDLNTMEQAGEIMYDRTAHTVLKPNEAGMLLTRGQSCNPSPATMPPNQFNCHGFCVNQKCRMTSSSCYYFITCPMHGQVGQQCLAHNVHMQGQCKMCCNDPLSPCAAPTGGLWQRCDCMNW